GQDGQFTPEQFVERINADLVNNLGNLVSRTVSMIDKYFGGKIPKYKGDINEFDHELEAMTNNTIDSYVEKMKNLEVTEAYIDVMNLLSRANKYIEESAPWVLAKDESKKENLESVMSHLARTIFVGSKLLEPILVKKTKEIFTQLGLNETETDFDKLKEINLLNNHQVNKTGVLFPRLDVNKEVEYIKDLMTNKK
ncbi:MAG: class I tRNA ligase family protein, partial [Bacilli bacterium]|nr:class I tRNA ligase family protein [Bacilli bacterium]